MPSTIHSNRFSSSVCRVQDEGLSAYSSESRMLAYVLAHLKPITQVRILEAIEADLAESGFLPVDPDEAEVCQELLAAFSAVHRTSPRYQLSSLIS